MDETQIITIEPGITAVEQPIDAAVPNTMGAPVVPSANIYVFNKETIIKYSESESDSVVVDIVLGVGNDAGNVGSVTKRLVLSKSRLLSDLAIADNSIPMTVVESVSNELKLVENLKNVSVFLNDPGVAPANKILKTLKPLPSGKEAQVSRIGKGYLAVTIAENSKQVIILRFAWEDDNVDDAKIMFIGTEETATRKANEILSYVTESKSDSVLPRVKSAATRARELAGIPHRLNYID